MDSGSKRRLQLAAGLAVLALAVTLSYFSVVEADPKPAKQDIFLVIDVSGSMADDLKLDFAKNAASEFVSVMDLNGTSDRLVGLIAFADTAYEVVGLTADQADLLEGIGSLHADGGTAMGDGINAAAALLDRGRPDAEKTMVVLSDGAYNSGADPLSASQAASTSGIRIFSVGYGHDADAVALQAVASMTDGEYFEASTGQELADAFGAIADSIISPVSHYSSRVMMLVAIPILLFIPAIEAGLTTMLGMADAPARRNVSKAPCPHCRHPNRRAAKFCLKCGRAIEKDAPAGDDAPARGNVSKAPCPHCRHPNRRAAKFCLKCGRAIEGDRP